jgi:phosphoribosylanthranilate isomerase
VKIKICGVTTPDDAATAAALGADAVGLNFHRSSPRFVTRKTARAILAELPAHVEAVGVFVERPLDEVAAEVRQLARLTAVQWYGQEPEPASAYPVPLIAAFNVRGPESLAKIADYLRRCRESGRLPLGVLVDAHVPGQHGGTGQKAPWDLLASFRPEVPLILAGGLTPENVAEAVRIVRPDMVDVASGVEAAPGHKDVHKMRRFIDSARAAS